MAIPGVAVAGSVVAVGSKATPAGAQGISSSNAVSTDAGNIATLGSDNLILVPQSQITIVRLRSFNAVGNPTFEVDQRNCHTSLASPPFICDRWGVNKAGATMAYWAVSTANVTLVPGTSFQISNYCGVLQLTTAQASLAATDYLQIQNIIEGSQFRELASDVHSFQVMAASSVANLKFGVSIRDPNDSRSLTLLCSLGAANTPMLFQFPNLPVFPGAGSFTTAPGAIGYKVSITLAAGTTYTAPSNNVWNNGLYVGALGQSNFAASAVNSTFTLFFLQNEPGALCTTPIDCPFTQNYDDCLRYFAKSYDYGVKAPTNTSVGAVSAMVGSNASFALGTIPFPKTLAKSPNLSVYAIDGTASAVLQLGAGGNASVNQFLGVGTKGFYGVGFPSAITPNLPVQMHYSADLGW